MIRLRKTTQEDFLKIPYYLNLFGVGKENMEFAQKKILDNFNGFYHDFYLAVDDNSDEVVGVVYSYNYMNYNLNCYMKALILPGFEQFGEEIISRFKNYLFKEYPLKHIYYKCNCMDKEMPAIEAAGFNKTAELKGYKKIWGEFVDEFIFYTKR